MEQKILVCYATGSGSTGEVADFIGQELQKAELVIEVKEASDVTDLTPYSAVIVGSSIRYGRWLPNALAFLDRFASELSERPVAYFMTCLALIQGAENLDMVHAHDNLRKTTEMYWAPILQRVPEVDPVGLGLFAGSLAPQLEQLVEYKGSPYGDYRDWDVIRKWVEDIGPPLLTAKPRSSEPLVLTSTILSYSDLSGYDLSRFNFQGSELVQTRLHDANLQEINLRQAKLQEADLRGADLSEADLGWADLREAQGADANFSQANLMGINLENADLPRANFSQAVLNGATISHTNLQQANFEQVDLNWADLRGSDLSEANLHKANLGWANLLDANLTNANLEGTYYNGQTKWPDDFSPEDAGCVLVHQVAS